MTKVFISFSHKDEKFVKEFHNRLKQAGVDCFCASESIRVGDNWVLELAKELDECKYFVPILTPDFSQSDWCIKETIIFLKADPLSKNRKILPLLRKKCKTPLDLYLEDIQYIDVSSEEKFERNFPEILNQIRGKGRAESQSIKPRKFPLTKDFPHQNIHFSGRDKILKDVRNTFLSGEVTQIRQLLCGMAGVGKTQIAIEYAYRHINDYNLIGWIDSEDQTCILKSFQSFAESLPPDREQLLGKKLVELVKQWLENNDGWLLIFDNAEEPKDINEFFPRSKCGHIIITSRHPNWGDWAKSFEILPMEEEEAVEFLKEIINGEDESQIKKLAKELGYLPLALAQAAIYIRNLKESIEDYLTLYRNYTREILERDMNLKDYDKSVASALKLSIRAVESLVSIDGKRKVGSDAVKLLKLFAFLGADNIPHELLTKYHPHIPPVLKDVLGNPYLVNDAIFALQKQSLIDSFRLPEGKFHSLHRIVQDVVRDCGLNRSGKKEWCQAAVQLLLEHFPFDPRNAVISPLSKTLLPHALSVVSHAKRLSLNTDEVINLTDKTYLCNAILQSDEGKPEDSLKSIRKVRGFRQPHSTTMRARCLDVMGDCYHIRDKYEKAKSHLDEARKIWRTQKEYEAFQRASERLAQVHELSGDLFKAKTLIQDTIKVVSVEAPGTHIFSSIYYREGVLARLFFELNNSLDSYRKSLHAAKREKNEVWQAYAKRGLGEIALLQGRLKHAEKHLEETIKLFEKTKHRGKVWIMRFQAEIQRQKAFKPKISHEEKNRLLGMAEKKYRDYIEKCKDMKNPNGEAWGWLRLAFLLLEREVAKETCRSREKSSVWTCIIKSEKLFKKTGSGIGFIEVIIGKGLAMAAGLCPEPGEKIKLLLEDARNRAQWKHLSKQLTILDHLISHVPGSPLSGPLWKEIRSPRNPT